MGVLLIPDKTGHERLQWDKDNPEQVEAARKRFNELKAKRGLMYRVDKKGEQGEVIHDFDPNAERIWIDASRVVGG
jgi:hypothetical protein